MNLRLHTIICSTRPGRVGPAVAHWFHELPTRHGKFEAHLVDLADFNLPLFDEPHHPRLQKYDKEHTRTWAKSVAAADAYVFVTPEYSYGPPPSFVNALNYLYREWNYKMCGFVSYGGASGGVRAVQLEKQLVATVKMMPMMEGVSVPMVSQMLDENKAFKSNERVEMSAMQMLGELYKWAEALKPLRSEQ